jgi:hypothetical protein
MHRMVMVMSVSALLLATMPFGQSVVALQHTVGADLGWFSNAPWPGLPWPWVLAAMGAAVLLSLGALLGALSLAVWSGDWRWIWGLGLLLPLGLFGWMAVVFGPLAGATLIFLPPVVAGIFGWQGVTQRRRTAMRRGYHPLPISSSDP